MKKVISFVSLAVFVFLCSCNPDLTKLKLLEAKSKEKTILFPEPFVILKNSKKVIDPAGASQISNWIKTETENEISKQLSPIHISFPNDSEYYKYGNELAKLMFYCEHKGIGDTIQIGKELDKLLNNYPDDLCLLVLNYGYSRSSANKTGQVALAVGVGLLTGLIGGFAIVPGLDINSNLIYLAVYSKSKRTVLYFDHDEDKDDPAIKKNTIEEISGLLDNFIKAGQNENRH